MRIKVRSKMDSLEPHFLTPAQCRARAELIRRTAEKTAIMPLRRQLLEIAAQYDRIAGSR
jgi:hypothetical protein